MGTSPDIRTVLSALNHPTTVDDRMALLRAFVTDWYGPMGGHDGWPSIELAMHEMPDVLRWWYAFAGRREQILNANEHLYMPDELAIVHGKLLFFAENQWVYVWATERVGEDPMVYGRWGGGELEDAWEPAGLHLSEFLIQACLWEAVVGAENSWIREIPSHESDRVLANAGLRPVNLPPLDPYEMRFYVGRRALASVTGAAVQISVPLGGDAATFEQSLTDEWGHV